MLYGKDVSRHFAASIVSMLMGYNPSQLGVFRCFHPDIFRYRHSLTGNNSGLEKSSEAAKLG